MYRPWPKRFRREHTILCLLAITTACGGGDRDAPSSTRVDSAGVTIVTSMRSAFGEREARIDSVPVLRIGAEAAGPYQFSFVSTALLLEGGAIAVVELSAMEIRLFDAAGQHVRSVGRSGRGPGEFQVITGLFRKSNDSLAAYDQAQRRVTILPLKSGELRTVRTEAVAEGRGNFDAFGAFGNGRLVLYNPGSGFRPDLTPGLQWVESEIVALDPTDGSTRIVGRLPSRQQFILDGGDTKMLAPAHDAIRAAANNGFYWGTSDRYEIRFFDTEGTLRRILRRPVESRPVLPAMTEQWIAENLERVRQREGEAAVSRYQQLYDDASFADRLPLFQSAFVDGNERLWVGSSEWPEQQAASRVWSIFETNGAWLGDVAAPAQLRIVDSRDDLVLGIWQEDGEAPYVHVHRLLRP